MLFLVHMASWIFMYIYYDKIYESQNITIFLLLATGFGIGFAIIATQKNAIIPILLNNSTQVFQTIGFFSYPSTALVFFLHEYLTIKMKLIIYMISLCLAVIPFFIFNSIRNALKPKL